MMYYRCRCGNLESWSSMGVARCNVCEKCNTIMASSPQGHAESLPHEWNTITEINDFLGKRTIKKMTKCVRCYALKDESTVITDINEG